ncbi:MAG: hypothetical protein M0R46_14175 [Candidatus Muirbacterium halophilum]|nr:hypothetical protein [Candidatus Muirbacterium halophilum]
MKILITPEDIIKRCLWDTYVYYIVGSEKEAEKKLLENKEFEISENDALVMGLLKVIETDNLVYKFNTYVMDLLTNKSVRELDQIVIKKRILDSAIDKFNDKFPIYWESNITWEKAINELRNYIDKIKFDIDKLEIITIEDKNNIFDFYSTNQVKKLLKFQY